MIIYIDENMPPPLAQGLHVLQQPLNARNNTNIEVKSIKTVFGAGTKDEDWIPLVGQQGACVLTQDYNIQRTRHQKALCEAHQLGLFFLCPPSKTGLAYWDMVRLCVERWSQLLRIIDREQRPFSYRCSVRKDFEKL